VTENVVEMILLEVYDQSLGTTLESTYRLTFHFGESIAGLDSKFVLDLYEESLDLRDSKSERFWIGRPKWWCHISSRARRSIALRIPLCNSRNSRGDSVVCRNCIVAITNAIPTGPRCEMEAIDVADAIEKA